MSSWCRCTARWTAPRQDAALVAGQSRRRIIVATNIAETSLTVSGVIGGDRHRSSESRALRRRARRRFADDRARHARQRRSARRPRRAARARHRAAPVGRARSAAAASRSRDSSRRSVRAAAVDPRVGRASRTPSNGSIGPATIASPRQCRCSLALARSRTAGVTDTRPADAAHAAASAARARAAAMRMDRSKAARRVRGCPSRRRSSGGRRRPRTCYPSSIAGIRCRRICGRPRRTSSRSRKTLLGNRVSRSHQRDRFPARPAGRLSGSCRAQRRRGTDGAWSRSPPVTAR